MEQITREESDALVKAILANDCKPSSYDESMVNRLVAYRRAIRAGFYSDEIDNEQH